MLIMWQETVMYTEKSVFLWPGGNGGRFADAWHSESDLFLIPSLMAAINSFVINLPPLQTVRKRIVLIQAPLVSP